MQFVIMIRLFILALLLIVTVPMSPQVQAQFLPRRGVTRPCPISSVPVANYQLVKQSPASKLVSLPAIPFENVPFETQQALTANDPILLNQQVNLKRLQMASLSSLKTLVPPTGSNQFQPTSLQAKEVLESTTNLAIQKLDAIQRLAEQQLSTIRQPLPKAELRASETKGNFAMPMANNVMNAMPVTRKPYGKKLFQWNQHKIAIDHCQISDMAVVIDKESSSWKINLNAAQNLDVGRLRPNLPVKRNRFRVQLSFQGSLDEGARLDAQNHQTGRPILGTVDVPPFWVERGQTTLIVDAGLAAFIKTQFELIDRVEIKFSYEQ